MIFKINERVLYPKVNDLKISKKKDQTTKIERVYFSGDIIFDNKSSDYEFLNTLTGITTPITVNVDSKDSRFSEYNGLLKLKGKVNYTDKSKELSIILNDQYKQTFDNEEIDIDLISEDITNYSLNSNAIPSFTVTNVIYNQLKKIKDVIEYIFSQIDSSIIFDSTSFYYLDNTTIYNRFLISCASNFVLNNEFEKSSLVDQLIITWKKLYTYLREYHYLYWFITTDNEFRLVHQSEITSSAGSIDFRNYKGKNLSPTELIEDDSMYYSLLKRIVADEYASKYKALQGLDIKYERIEPKSKKEITITGFYHGLFQSQEYPDKLPEESNSDYMVLMPTKDSIVLSSDLVYRTYNVVSGLTDIDILEINTSLSNLPLMLGYSYRQSNDAFGFETGANVFKVEFDLIDNGSTRTPNLFLRISSQTEEYGNITGLVFGHNILYIRPTIKSGYNLLTFYENGDQTGSTTLKVKFSNIEIYAYADFQNEDVTPNIGGVYCNYNATLYALDDFNKTLIEHPDSIANINGSDVTGLKTFKTTKIEIDAPLDSINDLSTNETNETDLGTMDIEEIEIPVDKSNNIAKIKGKI